jgi:hypothetical protein
MLPNASTKRKETEEEKVGLFSRFSKSESAAVTAIIAILLLGLVFTIISVVRLEYVPEWKDDAEQDHAYDIWDDMLGAKENIDMLSGLMESGNYPKNCFSATVPFNIGGGEVPVFESSKSHGKLEVNTERCRMAIKPYTTNQTTTNQTISPYCTLDCDGISCYSGNRQYPNQVFRYENGALILADGKSSIMKQFPAFTIEENKGNYTVTIRAVEILGKPNSVSSNTLAPLRLTGWEATTKYDSSSYNNTNVNAFDMTVATKYPHAWYAYFNKIAQDKRLNETDYTVELIPKPENPNSVRFYFKPSGNKTLERLCVNETIISAEIIPIRYQNVMKLNQLYCFDTVSNPAIDLSSLIDPSLPASASTQANTTGQDLSGYSPNDIFTYNLQNNNSLESTFGFNGFTEFESQPSLVTILMIYQPGANNPQYQDMSIIADTFLPKLTGTDKDKWYLYKQTVPCTSISDPSKLTYYIKINGENGKKEINIDYLAVYLS